VNPPPSRHSWEPSRERDFAVMARNVSTRYLAIAAEMVIGLVMLPFNLAHLGAAQYGLWVLLGSVTIHLSILDLGYGGGIIKFMAQYRARRDARALNEIASTMFFVFAAMGLLAYGVVALLAFNLDHIFKMTASQAEVGRWILLIIGVHVAINFPFSVYGGVSCGFQRLDANNMVAIIVAVTAAVVNAVVLLAGYGLVTLVAATTAVRVFGYYIYRLNALRIYPQLRIHPSLFRTSRLREVTGFSVYASIIDWANKLNYELDEVVIGIFFGSAYVGVWAVADRIISGTQRLTNQLNGVLFPVVVDSDTSKLQDRLQRILLQGTLLSLAMVVPISATLIVMADPLVRAWVGPEMRAAVPIIQILAIAVAIRVGNATATTLLKGAGQHRMLAWVNLSTGLVNILLSVVLIKPFGLVGVAMGTLIPIALSSAFIVQPAACRRVGLPIRRTLVQSVLPAIWPAFVVAGVLALTKDISSGTFLAVALQAVGGGVLYLTLFFAFAIGRKERTYYITKVLELTGRGPLPTAA
jgi:O-antigen/teichoic acid export membrane protein